MFFCFDKNLPFDYSKSEMAITRKNRNGILYDSEKEQFFDFEVKKIDISGKVIFPRTGVAQILKMNEVIKENGGIPIMDNEELNIIYDWPNYYSTIRKTKILKGKELLKDEIVTEIEKEYGSEIFIKTKHKNFSSIIPVELLKDTECAFYKALLCHSEEEFIISKKVTRLTDEYGVKEYRCFIVNNEIYNISRFTTDLFHKIDDKILVNLKTIVDSIKSKFPGFYVVDLFEFNLDGIDYIDVVEFNPIQASGLYLYNSCIQKSDDLLHHNIQGISSEFKNNIAECSTNGNVISADGNTNNLYNDYGSFAFDLRSICINGNPGYFFLDTQITTKDFARHEPIFNFENAVEIVDDFSFECTRDSFIEDFEMEEKIKKLLKENKDL